MTTPRVGSNNVHLPPFSCCTALLLALLIALPGSGTLPEDMGKRSEQPVLGPSVLGADVTQELSSQGRVRVLVTFSLPQAIAERGLGPTSAERRHAIAAVREQILEGLPAGEALVKRQFETVHAMALEVSLAGLEALLRDERVERIDLDQGGQAHLAQSVPLVGADQLQALGFTGSGQKVAVLDTGYDSDHLDLSDDLFAEQCFCSGGGGCCPGGGTSQSGAGSAEDDHGHGTNVSGIITSAGMVSSLGNAPDAGIIAVKVLAADSSFCCTSDIVAGLDWLASNHSDAAAVNMSLGTFALYPGDCDAANAFTLALAVAVNNLRSLGVTVFASSGNDGSGTQMAAPACVANSISVGAVYDANIGAAPRSFAQIPPQRWIK